MLRIHHAHNVALIVLRLHHLATLHHLHTNKKHSVRFILFVSYHQEAGRNEPFEGGFVAGPFVVA